MRISCIKLSTIGDKKRGKMRGCDKNRENTNKKSVYEFHNANFSVEFSN